ncbi:hypothetical protein LIA77_11061 [Sarocladium implicatum]|nr:hypothetical protein LIA77_11061 [Sarocladium implicatum]
MWPDSRRASYGIQGRKSIGRRLHQKAGLLEKGLVICHGYAAHISFEGNVKICKEWATAGGGKTM